MNVRSCLVVAPPSDRPIGTAQSAPPFASITGGSGLVWSELRAACTPVRAAASRPQLFLLRIGVRPSEEICPRKFTDVNARTGDWPNTGGDVDRSQIIGRTDGQKAASTAWTASAGRSSVLVSPALRTCERAASLCSALHVPRLPAHSLVLGAIH